MKIKVYCDICNPYDQPPRTGPFAVVETEELTLPLRGKHFLSIDPQHRMPAPFDHRIGWEFMFCPGCVGADNKHRVMNLTELQGREVKHPIRLRTAEGFLDLSKIEKHGGGKNGKRTPKVNPSV